MEELLTDLQSIIAYFKQNLSLNEEHQKNFEKIEQYILDEGKTYLYSQLDDPKKFETLYKDYLQFILLRQVSQASVAVEQESDEQKVIQILVNINKQLNNKIIPEITNYVNHEISANDSEANAICRVFEIWSDMVVGFQSLYTQKEPESYEVPHLFLMQILTTIKQSAKEYTTSPKEIELLLQKFNLIQEFFLQHYDLSDEYLNEINTEYNDLLFQLYQWDISVKPYENNAHENAMYEFLCRFEYPLGFLKAEISNNSDISHDNILDYLNYLKNFAQFIREKDYLEDKYKHIDFHALILRCLSSVNDLNILMANFSLMKNADANLDVIYQYADDIINAFIGDMGIRPEERDGLKNWLSQYKESCGDRYKTMLDSIENLFMVFHNIYTNPNPDKILDHMHEVLDLTIESYLNIIKQKPDFFSRYVAQKSTDYDNELLEDLNANVGVCALYMNLLKDHLNQGNEDERIKLHFKSEIIFLFRGIVNLQLNGKTHTNSRSVVQFIVREAQFLHRYLKSPNIHEPGIGIVNIISKMAQITEAIKYIKTDDQYEEHKRNVEALGQTLSQFLVAYYLECSDEDYVYCHEKAFYHIYYYVKLYAPHISKPVLPLFEALNQFNKDNQKYSKQLLYRIHDIFREFYSYEIVKVDKSLLPLLNVLDKFVEFAQARKALSNQTETKIIVDKYNQIKKAYKSLEAEENADGQSNDQAGYLSSETGTQNSIDNGQGSTHDLGGDIQKIMTEYEVSVHTQKSTHTKHYIGLFNAIQKIASKYGLTDFQRFKLFRFITKPGHNKNIEDFIKTIKRQKASQEKKAFSFTAFMPLKKSLGQGKEKPYLKPGNKPEGKDKRDIIIPGLADHQDDKIHEVILPGDHMRSLSPNQNLIPSHNMQNASNEVLQTEISQQVYIPLFEQLYLNHQVRAQAQQNMQANIIQMRPAVNRQLAATGTDGFAVSPHSTASRRNRMAPIYQMPTKSPKTKPSLPRLRSFAHPTGIMIGGMHASRVIAYKTTKNAKFADRMSEFSAYPIAASLLYCYANNVGVKGGFVASTRAALYYGATTLPPVAAATAVATIIATPFVQLKKYADMANYSAKVQREKIINSVLFQSKQDPDYFANNFYSHDEREDLFKERYGVFSLEKTQLQISRDQAFMDYELSDIAISTMTTALDMKADEKQKKKRDVLQSIRSNALSFLKATYPKAEPNRMSFGAFDRFK